jgi:hypothetical protein
VLKNMLSINGRKKLIAIFAIFMLVAGIGIYVFLKSNSGNKTLNTPQKAQVSSLINEDTCSKNMGDINKVDPGKLTAADAARVYNYRGNCYFEVRDNKKALEAFELMRNSCNESGNKACLDSAEQAISAVKHAMQPTSTSPGEQTR